ncbi:MAG: RloB family protein [Actinobacteria bacterium]|nr:RloB family protein [Actinomycetota bacterium]
MHPNYFAGLKTYLRNPAVHVRVKAKGCAPGDLVAYARALTSPGDDEFDEVWCVIYSDEYDLEPTARLAAGQGVRLAVSNPCFELWLLLHHRDHSAHLGDADAVIRQLTQYVPGYQKNTLRFADFESGVLEAVQRAERLAPPGCDHGGNPSSGVWRLACLIVDGHRVPARSDRWALG